jgi:pimeloyl-ACP methyl ester carboxylesterase
VLFDLRGHGRSERPLAGYRIEDGVDDLFGILDELSIDGPVHLVGNSYGGTIALAAALRRPERVAGMALIEAHPAFEGWAAEMIEDLSDLVAGFTSPGTRRYLDQAPRSVRSMARACEELITSSSMSEDLLASEPTTPERLATVACPSLLLYGENSDVLVRAYALEEAIAGSVLSVIQDCSHALLMENPQEVARQIEAWLDDQAKQGAPASRA